MSIDTTQDLFWLVLAFCVLWFTLFVSWTIYYFGMILKRAKEIIDFFHEILEKVDEIIATVREKLEKSAASLTLLLKAGKEVIDYVQRKKKQNKKKKDTL